MSPVAIVLLVAVAALVAAADWLTLARHTVERRRERERATRKGNLRLIATSDTDDFARSVEADLAKLPTIDERDVLRPT